MPHIKRTADPVQVSRRPVDPAVRDELECMTNNTLANVIRELSSLSRSAFFVTTLVLGFVADSIHIILKPEHK